MNKKLRNLAIVMGAALLGVPAVAGAESISPGFVTSTANLVCNPGLNVVEGSYGAWVANGSPGYAVCDTNLLTVNNSPAGQRLGKIAGRGAVRASICGNNNTATLGGCYQYASYTGTGNYDLAAPAQPLPATTGWTQRYLAIFLDSATSRVQVLH